MRLFLILSASIFHSILFGQELYDVHFETDQSALTQNEQEQLKKFAERELKNCKMVYLTGHTDNRASEAYNERLSDRRTRQVKTALIQLGIPEDKIQTDCKGEASPLNTNNSPAQMAENRRVTILWETMEPPLADSPEPLGDIRELYKLLEQKKQTFCIQPDRDTLLYLDQGTIIKIPANAFKTAGSNCVTFRAKEFYQYSDMILENLSTMSDGRLLETGGMVYTEAEDKNGNPVDLNLGKELTIFLPTNNPRSDMQLFYGERDPHSDAMNWKLGPNGSPRIPSFNFSNCLDWTPTPKCEECNLFFCRLFGRIDETMKGMVNKNQRDANKTFRQCQRNWRKGSFTALSSPIQSYCDSLYKDLGNLDPKTFQDSLVARLERQRKIRLKNTEMSVVEGKSSAGELTYYVANVAQLGWMNCDAFSGLAEANKINMVIPLVRTAENDCKLIFRDRRSLMNANSPSPKFTFIGIGSKLPVWVLALKYHDGKVFLSIQPQNTAQKGNEIVFEDVSLEELKAKLKALDGQ